MPKSIEKHLSADLLGTLDGDISDVEYKRGGRYLKITIYTQWKDSADIAFTEQDLVTLMEFLRKSKEEDK